jgi:hypothetical protein
MPQNPTWNKFVDTVQGYASVYGTEYYGTGTFPTLFGQDHLNDHDVPCAVCHITARPTVMVLPGRHVCYPGWTREYDGYLMAAHQGNAGGTEYICVDGAPERENRDSAHEVGAYLLTVESICGSLPCSPYVNGRELTCAVCSK